MSEKLVRIFQLWQAQGPGQSDVLLNTYSTLEKARTSAAGFDDGGEGLYIYEDVLDEPGLTIEPVFHEVKGSE